VPSSPSTSTRNSASTLSRVFHDARRDSGLAVLEGLHALKHALRFGAEVQRVVVAEPEQVRTLARSLAPDVAERMLAGAQPVSPEVFATLAPQAPATGVIAIAQRRRADVGALLGDARPAPIVLLEQPRHLGNLGACVRVAAAADIAGVLCTGVHDPWDPAAVRGSAGLHYALPVARLGEDVLAGLGGTRRGRTGAGTGTVAEDARPLVAVDPDGEDLRPDRLPARAILAFGSERQGLSEQLLGQADALVRLPMREGVSSLNLATSVAALLYAWRLS
jgi:TrmH family RNA methyltransferase